MDISQQILVEILKWLPVKSVLRFRSVSKSWFCLIDDDHFIQTHLAISKHSKPRLLCKNSYRKEVFSVKQFSIEALLLGQFKEHLDNKVPHLSELPRYHINFAGSCNGIICYYYSLNYSDMCYCLWNPSTRETKHLANPAVELYGNYNIGLGFDEPSGDYKVVVIRVRETYVYSLKFDLWKRIESLEGDGRLCINPIHIKGKIYWLRMKGNLEFYDLVSFDLSTETRKVFDFPMDYPGMYENVNLFGDRIYVAYKCLGYMVDIWLLKEDTWSWDKAFRIPIHTPGSGALRKLCARITDHGIVEIFGNFFISLDGAIDSNRMMIIEAPYHQFKPIVKWQESLVQLNRKRVLIQSSTN